MLKAADYSLKHAQKDWTVSGNNELLAAGVDHSNKRINQEGFSNPRTVPLSASSRLPTTNEYSKQKGKIIYS